MRTVQMTLDEELLLEVDQAVSKMGSTRSAFTRDALRHELCLIEQREMEEKHRLGYARNPVESGEFSDWEEEQVWPS